MWIINKYGVAFNTDNVARFRNNSDGDLIADMCGLPDIITPTVVGKVAVEDILSNIASGTKIMEVR